MSVPHKRFWWCPDGWPSYPDPLIGTVTAYTGPRYPQTTNLLHDGSTDDLTTGETVTRQIKGAVADLSPAAARMSVMTHFRGPVNVSSATWRFTFTLSETVAGASLGGTPGRVARVTVTSGGGDGGVTTSVLYDGTITAPVLPYTATINGDWSTGEFGPVTETDRITVTIRFQANVGYATSHVLNIAVTDFRTTAPEYTPSAGTLSLTGVVVRGDDAVVADADLGAMPVLTQLTDGSAGDESTYWELAQTVTKPATCDADTYASIDLSMLVDLGCVMEWSQMRLVATGYLYRAGEDPTCNWDEFTNGAQPNLAYSVTLTAYYGYYDELAPTTIEYIAAGQRDTLLRDVSQTLRYRPTLASFPTRYLLLRGEIRFGEYDKDTDYVARLRLSDLQIDADGACQASGDWYGTGGAGSTVGAAAITLSPVALASSGPVVRSLSSAIALDAIGLSAQQVVTEGEFAATVSVTLKAHQPHHCGCEFDAREPGDCEVDAHGCERRGGFGALAQMVTVDVDAAGTVA